MDPKQFLIRLKTLTGSLTPSQITVLALAFVAVVAIVGGSAYFLNTTSYRLLFSDMDAEEAAQVVARLEADDVPYQIADGGHAVRVPSDRVDEMRLQFAGEGLPASGRIGFEIFDRTAFGATEFLEQVNYRRALEGELARTISTIGEVSSARVHIAMAKDSLFGERERPAKASVVLKLRNSRPLAAATAAGIASLVSSSVEGLRPEAVVILDTFGRPLVRPSDDPNEALDGAHAERQQRLERDLAVKVASLLEPVAGADRVRVNVAVRLNPQSQEETEERWDPAAAVVRSRQTSADGAGMGPGGAGGVAGSRANLPPAAEGQPQVVMPAPASAAALANGRSAETTNYEISKVTRHTVRPRGDIARLSVAVLVDHEHGVTEGEDGTVTRTSRPRTAEEMQKMQGIVAAAVGLDTGRGDQLTIENIAFDEAPEEIVPPPSLWQRVGPQVMEAARIFAVVVLGALAFFFFIRPLVRRAGLLTAPPPAPAAALPQQLPRTVEELQGEFEARLLSAEPKAESAKIAALTKRLTTMSQKEPEHAARLIRTWLTEDEAR